MTAPLSPAQTAAVEAAAKSACETWHGKMPCGSCVSYATAAVLAAEPHLVAGCYICQPENPNAAEEGCDHCDAEASMYRHAEVLRTQLAAQAAQLQTVREATIRECLDAVTWRNGADYLFPGVFHATNILRALLDATPAEQATTAEEDDVVFRHLGKTVARGTASLRPVVQPDAAATCGHEHHMDWYDAATRTITRVGIAPAATGTHRKWEPCPASTDDGTGT